MVSDYTRFPDEEDRKPREYFTKILRDYCKILDKNMVKDGTALTNLPGEPAKYRAIGLWVFGSYARGSMLCGDLDLMLEVQKDSGHGFISAKAFLGPTRPRVRAFTGSPTNNFTDFPAESFVKIWGVGEDWNQLINAIQVNPCAGRFERVSSIIPLRSGQYTHPQDPSVYGELKRAVDEQEVSSTFTPISSLKQFNSDCDSVLWSNSSWDYWVSRLGKKKQQLLPIALAYLQAKVLEAGQVFEQVCLDFDSPQISANGHHVYIGNSMSVGSMLYRALHHENVRSISVLPNLETWGPNGVWTLECSTRRKQACEVYVVRTSESMPGFRESSALIPEGVDILELFTSRDAAQGELENVKALYEDSGLIDVHVAILQVQEHELQELVFSRVDFDLVCLDGNLYALSEQGAKYLELEFDTEEPYISREVAGQRLLSAITQS